MELFEYDHPKPGEWVLPIEAGYSLACCECSLVHRVEFATVDGRAVFRMWRDDDATKELRARTAKGLDRMFARLLSFFRPLSGDNGGKP